MQYLNSLLKLIVFLMLIAFIFAIKIFIGLAILSILIVPLTFIYSLTSGRSYNSIIDSSNILYKLNKFGQWSMIVSSAILLFYFIFKF